MPSTPIIRITVDGEDQFARNFERYDAAFSDLTPIWPDVRDEFWRIEQAQFNSEGSSGRSGKWKELSAHYKIQKIKQYGEKPIMQATGRLVKSLTSQARDTVYEYSKTEIAIGTSVPYGIHHQRGSGRLPKRELIALSELQKQSIMKAIQNGLLRELKKGKGYISPLERGR